MLLRFDVVLSLICSFKFLKFNLRCVVCALDLVPEPESQMEEGRNTKRYRTDD